MDVLGLRLVSSPSTMMIPTLTISTTATGTVILENYSYLLPWPGAKKGRPGNGQVTVTAFTVPEGSLPFWAKRLTEHGVEYENVDVLARRENVVESPQSFCIDSFGCGSAH